MEHIFRSGQLFTNKPHKVFHRLLKNLEIYVEIKNLPSPKN